MVKRSNGEHGRRGPVDAGGRPRVRGEAAEAIVDFMTLTVGIVALGDDVAGVFTQSDELASELSSASKKLEHLARGPTPRNGDQVEDR